MLIGRGTLIFEIVMIMSLVCLVRGMGYPIHLGQCCSIKDGGPCSVMNCGICIMMSYEKEEG
jgi:hypothetical protein